MEHAGLIPELDRARAAAVRAAEAAAQRGAQREAERLARVPADDVAPDLPVAQVLVEVPLAHLDRTFDYLVPAALHEAVVPGCRVKVRFAGRDVTGFVLGRVPTSEHGPGLSRLRRVVSSEPVLSPAVAALAETLAARYAGTRADVLRLAVPPRHATAERRAAVPAPPVEADLTGSRTWWGRYARGAELVDAVAGGASPRAVWTALPGEDWAHGLATLAAVAAGAGRGVLLCVPDRRALDRLDEALRRVLGEGRHVLLSADAGPAERYAAFLRVSRGAVQVVAGTRAAAFAPVRDLGLVAMWDDGDDLFCEPRAPYPHAREVLLTRAHQEGCAVVLGATSRSVEAGALVERGWAEEVVADRSLVRARAPRVAVAGSTPRAVADVARGTRLPSEVFVLLRESLAHGPVLVQTPRRGYLPALTCQDCRAPARCGSCGGPLHRLGPESPPRCGWCGLEPEQPGCSHCGGVTMRAPVVGDRRTAEELGRAFPAVRVVRSSGARVIDEVDGAPAIVVATPGAEPRAMGGYAAVVLLDTAVMLARADLRTSEESLRRWLAAGSLARSGEHGGRVLAVGDPGEPALQALVRWDPRGFAVREAADRSSAHLPPASRLAVVSGEADAVEAVVGALRLPAGAEVLGPAPLEDGPEPTGSPAPGGALGTPQVRAVVRVPRRAGADLSAALREVQSLRSARKEPPVRVQVDPYGLA